MTTLPSRPRLRPRRSVGLHTFEIKVPPRLLASTTYLLTVASASKYSGVLDHEHNCCEFTLRDLSTQDQSRPGVLGRR